MSPPPSGFRGALDALKAGERRAWERLFPLVYAELRKLAAACLRSERRGHTLEPTALVNELYLKLAREGNVRAESRVQFLGLCAHLMRQILVDHARGRSRTKRGGGLQRVSLDQAVQVFEERALDLIALDAALKRLEAIDRRKSDVVILRFFGGLSTRETAERLGVSDATVERDWTFARAWLRRELA